MCAGRLESAHLLTRMKDRKVTLPTNPDYRPAQQHLAWHRTHKFLGS